MEVAIVTGVLLHPFSLLATSIIEEEHFGYYFSVSVVYFFLLVTLLRKRARQEMRLRIGDVDHPDEEYIEKNLIVSSETPPPPLHPMNAFPVFFDLDSRLLRVLHGRMSWRKSSVLGSTPPPVASRRLSASRFLLLSLSWTLFRFLRAFNPTGDKWRHVAHLNDLLKDSDPLLMTLCVAVGILIALYLFRCYATGFVLLAALAIFGRFFPVFEKGGVRSGTLEAQFAYLSLFSLCLYSIVRLLWYKHCQPNTEYDPLSQKNVVLYFLQVWETFLGLLFILLQRPENVLVSSLCLLHFHLVLPLLVKNDAYFGLPRTYVYVVSYWVAQSHFFIQVISRSYITNILLIYYKEFRKIDLVCEFYQKGEEKYDINIK